MKVNKVILATNNNPIYSSQWDVVAPIWKNVFNIDPILVFYGSEDEFISNNFELNGYEYNILNFLPDFSESNPDWVTTWSLFFIASKYENDVCLLCGIDQIPLSTFFFEKLKEVDENKFVVGFADAYEKYNKNTLGYFNTKTNVMYPSSHLVGTGKKFKDIFNINNDWEKEIEKVYNSKDEYYLNNNFYSSKMWGIDECYSSEKISTYENKDEIEYFNIFWNYWYPRRIDLDGRINFNYDLDKLKDGYYSEFTCKNYYLYEKKFLEIINSIKKFE